MTRIAMIISKTVDMRALLGDIDLDLLGRRLRAIPMIVLGSEDVQLNPPVVGEVKQAVLRNGHFVEVESSSVALEFIHVHEKIGDDDNNLMATIAVAVIRTTLPNELVSSPNAFIIQNGSTSYGWDEGYGRAETKPRSRSRIVTTYVDDFIERRCSTDEAKRGISRILSEVD